VSAVFQSGKVGTKFYQVTFQETKNTNQTASE